MQSGSGKQAPARSLPKSTFYSVEYPGYVSRSSAPLAIENLGGHAKLSNTFGQKGPKNEVLELSLHRGSPYWHPIPGDVVATHNIVLKVTRRKRRRKVQDGNDGVEKEHVGDFKVEALGAVCKTARFRNMADFQYIPDSADPVAQLRKAMDDMDVQFIKAYQIPVETEEYSIPADVSSMSCMEGSEGELLPLRSNLRCFPPPLFSRQGIPQLYNYKANNMSVVTTVLDEETGEEKKRLINKARWRGYGPATILYAETSVPSSPPPNVAAAAQDVDQRIREQLLQRFEDRPVWTRLALCNQFNTTDAREIHNSKLLLPLVCYVFQDGPWRDTLVKFGYDPRKDPSARFFQRLYFRNLNHPIIRPSVVNRRHEGRHTSSNRSPEEHEISQEADRSQSHIFDGVNLTKETAAYQLCDIQDTMLRKMIEDDNALRDVCDERDGWYTTYALERIKTVLRHKFFSLLEGHIATEEECLSLLQPKSGLTAARDVRKRPGKHNMAKGALLPEDAALVRLRAKLDNNARSMWNSARRPD